MRGLAHLIPSNSVFIAAVSARCLSSRMSIHTILLTYFLDHKTALQLMFLLISLSRSVCDSRVTSFLHQLTGRESNNGWKLQWWLQFLMWLMLPTSFYWIWMCIAGEEQNSKAFLQLLWFTKYENDVRESHNKFGGQFCFQGQIQTNKHSGVSAQRGEVSPTHENMVCHRSNLKSKNPDKQDHRYNPWQTRSLSN